MHSEFDIIQRYFRRPTTHTVLGIGDDAALIAPIAGTELAVSTDTLVAGVHFFADTDANKLGHKALAVNLSDMAAMGAKPRWALLALTLPTELIQHQQAWLQDFSDGFFKLAQQYQVELIGGDTTAGPLNIGIQIIGEVTQGQALRRSGAQLGDDIWVSGQLGDAALALRHEQRQLVLEASEIQQCMPALLVPTARVELGQRLTGLAHSAIDISDGLMADLGHVLTSSRVAASVLLSKIPCSTVMKRYLHHPMAIQCLLAGGDDYELCFTAPETRRREIEDLATELSVPLTRIGKILPGEGLRVENADGQIITMETTGYDHFTA